MADSTNDARKSDTTNLPAPGTPPPSAETPRWGTSQSRSRAGWILAVVEIVLVGAVVFA